MTRFLLRRIGQSILVLVALIHRRVRALLRRPRAGPGGADVRGQARQRRPDRADQARAAPRPAALPAIRPLGVEPAARQLRLRLLQGPAGELGDRRGRPGHHFPGSRGRHHLDHLRRVHRGHLGGAVPVPDGPDFHRVGAVLLLDADVRPRPVADLDIRLQAQPGHHVLPVPRVRVHHHEPGPVVRVPHPALAHPRPGDRGHLYPADPHVDAGGTGRGLHQDRPVQGHEAKTA